MTDGIPALMDDLGDDTANVLLTLARIWSTLETGQFMAKDEAAEWAMARLADEDRGMLARARDVYRARLRTSGAAWITDAAGGQPAFSPSAATATDDPEREDKPAWAAVPAAVRQTG